MTDKAYSNHSAGSWLVPILAGLLPIIAVHLAYGINILWGDAEPCLTYWTGCVSVSMAVRSGPGLALFQLLITLGAVVMAMAWLFINRWLLDSKLINKQTSRRVLWLGVLGAAFLVLYALNLGNRTALYELLRRYGVIIYFGFTALAQLVLAGRLWQQRRSVSLDQSRSIVFWLAALVSMVWLLGIAFIFKRLLISNPEVLDRLERNLEWSMALAMSIVFILFGWMMRRSSNSRIN